MLETAPPRGTLHHMSVTSAAIAGNLVGAHLDRAVDVYVPAGGADGVPLLVDLVGFTGSGLSHTAWRAFGDNVPARLDRLIASGQMPPVAVAFPDFVGHGPSMRRRPAVVQAGLDRARRVRDTVGS